MEWCIDPISALFDQGVWTVPLEIMPHLIKGQIVGVTSRIADTWCCGKEPYITINMKQIQQNQSTHACSICLTAAALFNHTHFSP